MCPHGHLHGHSQKTLQVCGVGSVCFCTSHGRPGAFGPSLSPVHHRPRVSYFSNHYNKIFEERNRKKDLLWLKVWEVMSLLMEEQSGQLYLIRQEEKTSPSLKQMWSSKAHCLQPASVRQATCSMSRRLHNFLEQHHHLWTKCSNTWAWREHFTVEP